MRLFIAEKSKTAEKIRQAIGTPFKFNEVGKSGNYPFGFYANEQGDVTIACQGHMIELCEPHDYNTDFKFWDFKHLPMFFEPLRFKEKDDKKAQLKMFKALLQKADTVVHCGDIDEEGQLIVDNIVQFYGFKGKVLRCWPTDETLQGFENALKKLTDNERFHPMGYQALARTAADQLLGFNITRALSLTHNQTLHVGRVKSPIMGLVAMRENAHNGHTETFYNVVTGQIVVDGITIPVTLDPPQDTPNNGKGAFIDENTALSVVESVNTVPQGIITQVVTEHFTKQAPMPFTAESLQKEAARILGFSPKETMDIAQEIKDAGYISYHRTDTATLPQAALKDVGQTLDKLSAGDAYNIVKSKLNRDNISRAWGSGDTEFTHHGIIPLANMPTLDKLEGKQRQLFDLIQNNYLAQFMPNYEYDTTTVQIKIGEYFVYAKAKIDTQTGWIEVLGKDSKGEEAGVDLRRLQESMTVQNLGFKNDKRKTKPPALYTNETLVHDIARAGRFSKDTQTREYFTQIVKDGGSAGLGTPATTAGIIEELFNNEYLANKGKSILLTDKGKKLVNLLDDRLRYPDLTAVWQLKMKKIQTLADVMTFIKEVQQYLIEPVVFGLKKHYTENAKTYQCPDCGQTMVFKSRTKKDGNPYYFYECTSCPCKIWAFADGNTQGKKMN